MDRRVCYPNDDEEKKFLLAEQETNKATQMFYTYFSDIWYEFAI